MAIYLGIDPGVSGAIAIHGPDGPEVYDMPLMDSASSTMDPMGIMELLRKYPTLDQFCTIEKAQVMSKQGIVSSGNYMKGYGMVLACLYLAGIPFYEVSPQTWKKPLGLTKKAGSKKETLSERKTRARKMAIQMFPNLDLHRQKDHGRAEALLIGYYGKRYVWKT